MLGIDADVDLVTECALLALAAPARVGIGRSLAGLPVPGPGLARRPRPRRNQRGVDQRAMLDDQALGLELPVDLREHPLRQAGFGQLHPEAPQRAVIGHRIMQAQPGKPPERQAVLDGVLQRRIGQIMPNPEQQTAQQQQARIAGRSGSRPVARAQNRGKRRPVHHRRNVVQHALGYPGHKTVRQAQLTENAFRHDHPPAESSQPVNHDGSRPKSPIVQRSPRGRGRSSPAARTG